MLNNKNNNKNIIIRIFILKFILKYLYLNTLSAIGKPGLID